MSLFLTSEEVKALTGIKRGRDGKSASCLQCEFLRRSKLPFFTNARGEPMIARSTIEGTAQVSVKPKWQPTIGV